VQPIEIRLTQEMGEGMKSTLYHDYIEKRMTVQKMAIKYGVSRKALTRLLNKLGIKTRTQSEALKIWWQAVEGEDRQSMVAAAHARNKELAKKGELSFQRVWREEPERMREQVAENALKMCKNRKRNGMTGQTGPKHHLWNGSKTKEERTKFRKTEEHYAWVRAVYERDKYTCQVCGYDKGGTLNAHHLDSYADHEESRHDVGNGVTLCEGCHVGFHGAYGYGKNTKEQFDKYCKGVG